MEENLDRQKAAFCVAIKFRFFMPPEEESYSHIVYYLWALVGLIIATDKIYPCS